MVAKKLEPIVGKGRNVWRIARAAKASVIVDAADYYRIIGAAMEAAEKRIFIVGWDFDTRIPLNPDERGQGETFGRFFLRLARDRPARTIDILKWNFGALKQFMSPAAVVWLAVGGGQKHRFPVRRITSARLQSSPEDSRDRRLSRRLRRHRYLERALGHQRPSRWRSAPHRPRRQTLYAVARRNDADGRQCGRALSELGRERWKVSTKAGSIRSGRVKTAWPAGCNAQFEDVDIAIARTRAAYEDLPEMREIEALYIDMICAAQRFIYVENQYFTSGKIAAAIAKRMSEPDPPEIVMVMARKADGWLEQKAMDGARNKLVAAIGAS